MLEVAEHRHASGEERNVPDVREGDRQCAVGAEDPHRRERAEDSHPEGNHVGERGDRDANSCFAHHVSHALRHGQLHGCSAPGRQHHKRIVDADA